MRGRQHLHAAQRSAWRKVKGSQPPDFLTQLVGLVQRQPKALSNSTDCGGSLLLEWALAGAQEGFNCTEPGLSGEVRQVLSVIRERLQQQLVEVIPQARCLGHCCLTFWSKQIEHGGLIVRWDLWQG